MVQKKARHGPPPAKSRNAIGNGSPVVSDDDEAAAGALALNDADLDGGVEYLGYESEGEGETEGIVRGRNAHVGDEDEVGAVESDSSSEGDFNPVGDIPMRWYEGYDHIGYDRSGQPIIPQNQPSKLDLAADPHAWRRVYDEKNDQDVVLSHEELRAIARMRAGRYPSAGDDPAVEEFIAWSGEVEKHPLTAAPEPKRRFLPSRHEARSVIKMVRAMRAGKMKRPSDLERERANELEGRYNYDVWESNQPKDVSDMTKSERARDIMRIAAPKVPLPKHEESYNPPEEYLPTKQESAEWKDTDPEDRVINYLPTKHDSLRHVPLYENFIKERFERCLDLYLAVRVRQDAKRVNPEDLIPELPSPRDLRPFPSGRSSSFGPLPSRGRSISVHPAGMWLLTGSDDGAIRLWEVMTGCLRHTWWLGKRVPKVDGQVPPVTCVAWCPNTSALVFAVSIGNFAFVVSAAEALGMPEGDSHAVITGGDTENGASREPPDLPDGIVWKDVDTGGEEKGGVVERAASEKRGLMLSVDHPRPLRMLAWHNKGDYFATVGKDSTGGTIAIHRLSKKSSQLPFKKKMASVQAVRFHPTRPFFFVATMHNVRIYNLAAQEAVKTLKPGVRWISNIEIHNSGDHVLVSSYDKRLCWFDLDLSAVPYKTLRNHTHAVRAAKFHPRLPLFASAADDGSVHVFHGTVYDDLNKNALIVPLKRLERYHTLTNSLGVLDIEWHPRLPWLFSSGADGQVHIFSDMSYAAAPRTGSS